MTELSAIMGSKGPAYDTEIAKCYLKQVRKLLLVEDGERRGVYVGEFCVTIPFLSVNGSNFGQHLPYVL